MEGRTRTFWNNHLQINYRMLGFDFGRAADLRRYSREFEELQKLGSGGFSTVYRVRHKLDDAHYAIKVIQIKPSLYHNKPNQLYQHFEKMLNQTKILASLAHQNILRYHGCWIECLQKTQQDIELEDQNHSHNHSKKVHSPQNSTQNVETDQVPSYLNHNRNKAYSSESENDFQMVMYDDESNSGIQFVRDSFDQSHKNSKKETSSHSPIEGNTKKTTQTSQNSQSQELTAATQSLFGTDIFKRFKQIIIYIQTEAGEKSLQHYVEQRNFNLSSSQHSLKSYWLQNYRFILDIIRGLSYIHSRKVIHRDLKLQNVIIDSSGRCKIIDYGLAKKVRNFGSAQIDSIPTNSIEIHSQRIDLDAELTEEEIQKYSSSVGTKIFSSPQQACSNKYDHRTDIFSLGMIICILFSRFATVHGQRQLLLDIRNKKLNDIDMDQRLREILMRCLSEQKMRPNLSELQKLAKSLMREQLSYQRNEKIKITEHESKIEQKINGSKIEKKVSGSTGEKSKRNNQKLKKSVDEYNNQEPGYKHSSAIKFGQKQLYFTKEGGHFEKKFSLDERSELTCQTNGTHVDKNSDHHTA